MYLNLTEITKDWPEENGMDFDVWKIAPKKFLFAKKGIHLRVGKDCWIHESVLIERFCVLGDYVSVERNSSLREGCMIGDNVWIGESCEVATYATVGNGCTMDFNSALFAHCNLHDGLTLLAHEAIVMTDHECKAAGLNA
jgi:UDP-3-O-[3-hydroxymyristoyl] glucosamine N-acyltransferase